MDYDLMSLEHKSHARAARLSKGTLLNRHRRQGHQAINTAKSW